MVMPKKQDDAGGEVLLPWPEPHVDAAVAHPEVERRVAAAVRERVKKLAAATPATAPTPNGPAPATVPIEALAAVLEQVIFDAIRFGLSLASRPLPQAAATPTRQLAVEAPAAQPEEAQGPGGPTGGMGVQAPTPQAGAAQRRSPRGAPPEPAVPQPAAAPQETPGEAWQFDDQVTLVASPFTDYAAVMRFMRDLEKVPRLWDVKPRRFTAGKLYVSFRTELPDVEVLVDTLRTALALYQPEVHSFSHALIDIGIAAPPPPPLPEAAAPARA